jgi:hypothetical protein
LGFVALNPTYILPVLLRIAKPNNGQFRNRAQKVFFSIGLAVFLAGGSAHMKIREENSAGYTTAFASKASMERKA